jgi:CheY-like chemotaxis protein
VSGNRPARAENTILAKAMLLHGESAVVGGFQGTIAAAGRLWGEGPWRQAEAGKMKTIEPMPRVLVVEDEWVLRESTAAEFEDAGWSVLEASSAEEALALLQPYGDIDALVTDIRLAGNMDGFELAKVLYAAGHEVPVVYVSGSAQHPERMMPRSIFQPKPVSPRDLIALTETLVRGGAIQ